MPDYSALWARNRHYHENYRRRARQHYMAGLPPGRIQRVIEVDFGLRIPYGLNSLKRDDLTMQVLAVDADVPRGCSSAA